MDNYDHVPRPFIEHHYHIRELIERQERRVADRNDYRNRKKARDERESVLLDSKSTAVTDFWCDRCKKDFKCHVVRQIENDWHDTDDRIAFYKTKHDCGNWCMRYITDKSRDPFWFKSKLVALDRGNHYADTLQPFETGFNLLYGKK
jgi:hypothetical protein